MKNKFSRILGVGLSLAMLASLLVMATPASAGTLSLTSESDVPKTENNVLAPAGTAILDLAVKGDVLYAATQDTASAGILYKSTNGGKTWTSLETSTDWPATDVMLVAVAPDDANVVAVAMADKKIFYSSNGGSSWSDMGAPTNATAIADIDVSGGPTYYVAAAGANTTNADLFTLKLAIAQNWVQQGNKTGFRGSQSSLVATQFSPNFKTDKIIGAISQNSTDNTAYFQVFRLETGQESWNGNITFFDDTDWGTGTTGGIDISTSGNMTGGLVAGSIAFDPSYLGTDLGRRIVFAGVASGTTAAFDGVFRVVDSYTKKFETWNTGDEGAISSLALSSDGKLLAGSYTANRVYTTALPMATDPKFDRVESLKQPGGVEKTIVAWSGTTAVAGTQGDDSAFAVSTDNGKSFNDISLIDTALTNILDVAVNADGTQLYLTSYDSGNDASVWHKAAASTWHRIFTLKDQASATLASLLVRAAPEDFKAVYISQKSTTEMWVSKDSGMASWTLVPAYKLDTIEDFLVVNANTVYAVDANEFSKTTNAGASWETEVAIDDLSTAARLSLAPKGEILVGGTDYFAYSLDNGVTFTRTGTSPASGAVFVIADKDFTTNKVVYAGSGAAGSAVVKRGKAQKESQVWSTRGPPDALPIDSTHTITGMTSVNDIIYVLTSSATDVAIHRPLNLTSKVDSSELALWSNKTGTAGAPPAVPNALKGSGTKEPKLWHVATEGTDALRSMVDPIATVGPTLTSPADGIEVALNRETGKAFNVVFTWKRYSSSSIDKMQLQIATDSAFTGVISDITFSGIDSDSIAKIVGPTGPVTTTTSTADVTETTATYTYTEAAYTYTENLSGNVTTITVPARTITVPATTTTVPTTTTTTVNQVAEFNPGATYYWRVRVAQTGPLYSPWSKSSTFKVEPPVAFALVSPTVGAEGVGTVPTFTWTAVPGVLGYEIAVAEDPTFAVLDWIHNASGTFYKTTESDALAYGTAYNWRVRGIFKEAFYVGTRLTPAVATPWQTGIFTTMAEPTKAEPTVITIEKPAPAAEVKVIEVPVPGPAQAIPSYLLWMIIAIGAVLIIALIVLIVRTRRVA